MPTLNDLARHEHRRLEKRFGMDFPTGCVAVFTFDRSQLEDLIHLYPQDDGFVKDVRDAMRWMDAELAADTEF